MASKFYDHRDIKWPGTWLVENTLPSAIPNIPFNRTLYVQQFTDEAPSDVEFVKDCQTVKDVFDKYQPGKTVALKDEEGVEEDVDLQFRSMKDFGREGIVEQSELLNRIASRQQLFEGFMDKLTDEQLAILLSDADEKAAYIAVLESLIEELDKADPGE